MLPKDTTTLLMRRFRQVRWERLILLVVLLLSAWRDASLLMRYPVGVGIDGYYYVLQIDSFRNYGQFYFPTNTPLVLYVLSIIGYLLGNTILAIKIGSITLHALLCWGIFELIKSTTRSAWFGVLGSSLAAFSALHFFMIAEYIKNLGAITLLIWAGWFAIRAIRTRRIIWLCAAIIFLLMATFSHRSALIIILIVGLSIFLARWLLASDRRSLYYALTIIFVLWIAPAIIAAQTLIEVPEWVGREFSASPHWPLRFVAFNESLILLIVAPATLVLLILLRRQLPTYIAGIFLGSIALWSLIFTINPFLNTNRGWLAMTGRMGGLSYIQVAILLPGLIWLLLLAQRKSILYIYALILPLIILTIRAPLPHGLLPAFLSERMLMIQNLPSHRQQLGPKPLIIAPHGDQFVFTYTLGVPSQQRLPERNKDQTIYWALYRVESKIITPSMIVLAMDSNRSYLVLIEDTELQRMLEDMPEDERKLLLKLNPHYNEAHYLSG